MKNKRVMPSKSVQAAQRKANTQKIGLRKEIAGAGKKK